MLNNIPEKVKEFWARTGEVFNEYILYDVRLESPTEFRDRIRKQIGLRDVSESLIDAMNAQLKYVVEVVGKSSRNHYIWDFDEFINEIVEQKNKD